MKRHLISILSIFIFASCSMPETKIYSIFVHPERRTDISRMDTTVNISIHSHRYLSQPYIAHRISPYQLEISRYEKWDSSPAEILREAFRDSLSSIYREVKVSGLVSSNSYSVDINLKRFEKSGSGDDSSGEVAFDVSLLAPDSREVYRNAISKKIKLSDRNTVGLARALSTALAEGMEEATAGIANHIRP